MIFIAINKSNGQNNYDVNLIPKELLENANAVKRLDETKIVVDNIGKATIHHKYAITILNEGGDECAEFFSYYDKFINVRSVEGKLFDAAGNKIRTMKKDDLKDISAVSEANLIDDDRIKLHNFEYKLYPYTIEYESETEFTGIFYFPQWEPADYEKLSVQSATLEVQCPTDYQLRCKVFNYDKKIDTEIQQTDKIYKWNVENIPAITEQQYEPEWHELTPTVFLAPTDFEMEGYHGNMSTWNAFGKFIYSLNQGRDELPDNIKQVVHSLTDKLSDVHEKIRVLYRYLQKNTRYVSIQLGIGGWQTFDAGYVAAKGYGDCKALSNYMHSLLKEAGIKAYYTLIKAGEYKTAFIDDFPSNQFNHIIVCVPVNKDTTWLECTSSTLPAGYLSGFTCNRSALLVDENGGTLVHTPDYSKEENLQERKISGVIDSSGSLNFVANTKYTGMEQDELREMLNALSKEKIMERLKEYIELPSYDVTDFDYKEEKNSLPAIDEKLTITSNNYAAVSGKRIFINPDILTRYQNKLTDYDKRTCDIVMRIEYRHVDSVEISIPEGYVAESVPSPVSITSKFGSYSCSSKVVSGKIIYYRENERINGRYPASDAKALADFFDKISKADRSKIVLVKN
jgi:hypothetical protein